MTIVPLPVWLPALKASPVAPIRGMGPGIYGRCLRPVLKFTADLEFGSNARQSCPMKILTDDPDWKREVYEARALAITVVGRSGRSVPGGRQAVGNGLTVTYRPDRSPVQLMIDAAGDRVLSIEWKPGDAWRMEIETYNS